MFDLRPVGFGSRIFMRMQDSGSNLLIYWPYCSLDLPELEFSCAVEAHVDRPEYRFSVTDEVWRDSVFACTNARGRHFERWRHIRGCGRFFNAVHHTVSVRFLKTYEAGAPRPSDAELREVVRSGPSVVSRKAAWRSGSNKITCVRQGAASDRQPAVEVDDGRE